MDIHDMIRFQEEQIFETQKQLRKQVDDWKKLAAQRDKIQRDFDAKELLKP